MQTIECVHIDKQIHLRGSSLRLKQDLKRSSGVVHNVAPGINKRFSRYLFSPKGDSLNRVSSSGTANETKNVFSVWVVKIPVDVSATYQIEVDCGKRPTAGVRNKFLAVISPDLFNRPEVRDILHSRNMEVYVQSRDDNIPVKELEPWIERMIQEEENPAVSLEHGSPAVQELAVSAKIRDPGSGKIDARRVSEVFGLRLTQLVDLCGVTKQALSRSPTSARVQERLAVFDELCKGIVWCGGDEEVFRTWLNRPNPDFMSCGGPSPTPMALLLRGQADLVAARLEQLLRGLPA